MAKIYLVTTGSYSDFSVMAVFNDKTKAKSYYRKLVRGQFWNPGIKTYELNCIPKIYKSVEVYMDFNGNSHPENTRRNADRDYSPTVGFSHYWKQNENVYLVWTVHTNNLKRAIKIVNEKRAQIVANNFWNNEHETMELFNPTKHKHCKKCGCPYWGSDIDECYSCAPVKYQRALAATPAFPGVSSAIVMIKSGE